MTAMVAVVENVGVDVVGVGDGFCLSLGYISLSAFQPRPRGNTNNAVVFPSRDFAECTRQVCTAAHTNAKFIVSKHGRPSIHVLHLHLIFLLPPWVFLKHDKALQNMCEWNELFRSQLCPFCCTKAYGRLMCLETRDSSWFACLANNIDGL